MITIRNNKHGTKIRMRANVGDVLTEYQISRFHELCRTGCCVDGYIGPGNPVIGCCEVLFPPDAFADVFNEVS